MVVKWNGPQVVARVTQAAQRGLVRGAEEVRSEAVRLVLEPPKTGRIYRRRGVEHQASAPGEAPASDTGTLVSRIATDYADLSRLVARVGAHTEYAAHLEFGTSRMEPRPFMRPALATVSPKIEDYIAREVRAALL